MEKIPEASLWRGLEDSDKRKRRAVHNEMLRMSFKMFKRIAACKSKDWGRELLVSYPVSLPLGDGTLYLYCDITCQKSLWALILGKDKAFVRISLNKSMYSEHAFVQAEFHGKNGLFPFHSPYARGRSIAEIERNTKEAVFSNRMRAHLNAFKVS